MRVKFRGIKLYCVNRNVGTVVGNTLKIGKQVREHKTELYRTFAALKSFNMARLKCILKVIDNLFKRFNVGRTVCIVIYKRIDCDVKNFYRCIRNYSDFVICIIRKNNVLFLDFFGRITDIKRVVTCEEVGKPNANRFPKGCPLKSLLDMCQACPRTCR